MNVWGNATFEIKNVVDRNPNLYLKRAEIALKAGRYEDAADEIVRAEIYADGNNAITSQCLRIKTALAQMGFISDLDVLSAIKHDANNGKAKAVLLLGCVYDEGLLGEEVDYKVAFEYYSKAIQLGASEANYYIGNLYYFGLEVNKDYLKAYKYYLEAIKTENETTGLAFLMMGNMYLDGLGVKKHTQTALKMFLKATKYSECKGQAFYKMSHCFIMYP